MNYFTVDALPHRFPWHGRMPIDLWHPLRQWVYERDDGKCCYCAEPKELFEIHCHHVLELSEGGTNHPSNLKTLCCDCHKHRHPFMLSVMERLCGKGANVNIKQIKADWDAGMTHGKIAHKHELTGEQEYAITVCSDGLTVAQIEARLQEVQPGMSALEIEAVMQGQS